MFGRQTPRRWGWGTPLKKRAATRTPHNVTFWRIFVNKEPRHASDRRHLKHGGTPAARSGKGSAGRGAVFTYIGPVDALESASLFRHLSAEELQALRQMAQERAFAAGAEVFREGEPGDGVYIIKTGLVEISGRMESGARCVFSRFGPGEMFGEMAVIEQGLRSATAMAVQETTVYFFPLDIMLRQLRRSPVLSFNLLQEISRRLRDFNRLHLREALQAERVAAVGNFARAIVHDLKTPLTMISLAADLADSPDLAPEERAGALSRIRKQVWRVNGLITDLLEFTRSSPAQPALRPTIYSKFIADFLPELRAEVEARAVRLELQNSPPPVPVRLDAVRLRRVFFNLAHNAAEAMGEGGKIFLRFEAVPTEVITEMEDTGPGLAPEMAGRLFEPFATHGKGHGTGLGLTICKNILTDHGGRIWTRTEPERGAIFCFALPHAQ